MVSEVKNCFHDFGFIVSEVMNCFHAFGFMVSEIMNCFHAFGCIWIYDACIYIFIDQFAMQSIFFAAALTFPEALPGTQFRLDRPGIPSQFFNSTSMQNETHGHLGDRWVCYHAPLSLFCVWCYTHYQTNQHLMDQATIIPV